MNVLLDHQIFDLQKFGGISRCFVELYKHLPDSCQAKIAVRESDNVYVGELEGIKPFGYQYNHFICNHHFIGKRRLHLLIDKVKKINYYPNYNKNYSVSLLKSGKFDVFHPTFFDDYFLPYLNGKPFILTIHDMIPELYPQYFGKDHFQIIMKRKLAPLASAIVAVSEHTKQDIMRILGVPEEKIHVVYHGCSFSKIDVNPLFSFPYFIYVGERGYYKNFNLFLSSVIPVLKNHNNINVVCTGKPFTNEEIEIFRYYGVEDRFFTLMVNTDEELYSLYHYALGFVYPSEYEGFGIPILEAYQAGCPVILSNTSCFPEIAGEAALFFSNSDELTNQIENVIKMSSEEQKKLLIKQNKRLERYSWGKSAMQMAEIYQSCI